MRRLFRLNYESGGVFVSDRASLDRRGIPAWAALALALGLYLTVRGYRGFDGDQAYRLPLLLHQQNHRLYERDPFVQALEQFNPHRGYLRLLDAPVRALGLAAAIGLFYTATFALTGLAISRLARSIWPDSGRLIGWLAFAMFLTARAGNIGTNHLFEPLLLDRLIALALIWTAIALSVGQVSNLSVFPALFTAAALSLAAWVHPSYGLQSSLLLLGGWLVWFVFSRWTAVSFRSVATQSFLVIAAVGGALVPTLNQSTRLFEGLPQRAYLILAAEVQSPQHMLPHLWRMPQWLAFFCYPALAFLGLKTSAAPWPIARRRVALLLAVALISLVVGWFAVEVMHDARATIAQPFRLATIARGLCIICAASRVHSLWTRGDFASRARSMLLVAGLAGDWLLVVATGIDLAATLADAVGRRFAFAVFVASAACGVAYLSRHDTQKGHYILISCVAAAIVGQGLIELRARWALKARPRARLALCFAAAWALPACAALAPWVSAFEPVRSHIRFDENPIDDIERLAVWCRQNTPSTARFIGPPGPKTFRLWSRRSLAFNRAGSPYHAAGLADWAERFRDHVALRGDAEDLARAYLQDRQALEKRYDALSDRALAELARRQDAEFVVAATRVHADQTAEPSPLILLRSEGRYAVYRLGPRPVIQTAATRSAGTG